MNKLIVCMTIAGTVMLSATATLAQDARAFGPSEAEPAPKASQKTRRAEGEQMLGSMKGQARVSYAKHGEAPETLTGKGPKGANVAKSELEGKYCRIHDKVYRISDQKAALIAEDFTGKDGFCLMDFTWAGGVGSYTWYDTLQKLIEANEDVEIEDTTTSSDSDESPKAEEVKDPYALYRKLGRKWKHKSTTTIEGMEPFVSYVEYEITKVTDTYCVQKMTMRDKDDQPMPGLDPMESRIEFHEAEGVGDAGMDPPELKRETMKVKAGEFECYVVEVGATKSWSSIEYPGLLVKMEGKQTEMELIEFSDGPENSEADPARPADDEGSKEADMSDYWERYVSTFKKGRTWTYEATAGVRIKNEVTEVTETKATVKITTLLNGNPIGDPTDTEYDLVQKDSDGAEDYKDIKWQEKEIEIKAGTFTGISMDGEIWMMKKHPMILLKGAGTELVEFKD